MSPILRLYVLGAMLGKARFDHIERSASEAIRNLRNAEELEEYRTKLLALDEQIDELVMLLGPRSSSPSKPPDYSNLNKAKAERLLTARKKRIEVLEAAFAKQQQEDLT